MKENNGRVFELQKGDLVVTDRANGLRQRIIFVLSKLADIIVRISPSKFPMEDEQGEAMVVIDWLKGLQASAGAICSRSVWITYAHKRIKLRLIAFRLSQEQQQKAERRTKRKARKNHETRAAKHGVFLGMGPGSHHIATRALE
jgi:hypothetical protein